VVPVCHGHAGRGSHTTTTPRPPPAVQSSYVMHELRVPLNSITLGLLDLAEDGGMPDVFRPLLRTLKAAADGMVVIISDMLDLSRMERGGFAVHPVPTVVTALANEAVRRMAPFAAELGVSLNVEASALSGLTAMLDPARVMQILTNLLSNAIKFSPHDGTGSVVLRVTQRPCAGKACAFAKAHLEAPPGAASSSSPHAPWVVQHCCFEVKDNGCGIPSAELELLFKPFVQLAAGEAYKGRGTGLGLAITRNIAEKHCGVMAVRSQEGVGSVFSLDLHVAVVEGARLPPPPSMVATGGAAASATPPAVLTMPDATAISPTDARRRWRVGRGLGAPAVTPGSTGSGRATTDASAAGPLTITVTVGGGGGASSGRPVDVVVSRAGEVGDGDRSSPLHLSPPPTAAGAVGTGLHHSRSVHSRMDSAASKRDGDPIDDRGRAHREPGTPDATELASSGDGGAGGAASVPTLPLARSWLIVDDVVTNAKLLARVLQRRCPRDEFVVVHSGTAALAEVGRRGAGAFACVITDKEMPGMNGYELSRQLRGAAYRGVLLGCTGNAAPADRAAFMAAGADDAVFKPVDPDALLGVVEGLLADRRRADGVEVEVVTPRLE
jgi:CheY-like chemotaxis protein